MNEAGPGAHPTGTFVSSGRLPPPDQVQALVNETYRRFKDVTDGALSTVYPALAEAPPHRFGLTVQGVGGQQYSAGESQTPFTVMSVAKPFTFALVCQVIGGDRAGRLVGVNATGLPFNSAAAVETSPDGRTNPMVNAGAIATVSHGPGRTAAEKWGRPAGQERDRRWDRHRLARQGCAGDLLALAGLGWKQRQRPRRCRVPLPIARAGRVRDHLGAAGCRT